MLYVDFSQRIGHMWRNDDDNNLVEDYDIYYCPNALFAIFDKEGNLFSFASDEEHLKNMLGLSKGYEENIYKDFNFSFTYWNATKNKRQLEVFKLLHKIFSKSLQNYFTITYMPKLNK